MVRYCTAQVDMKQYRLVVYAAQSMCPKFQRMETPTAYVWPFLCAPQELYRQCLPGFRKYHHHPADVWYRSMIYSYLLSLIHI